MAESETFLDEDHKIKATGVPWIFCMTPLIENSCKPVFNCQFITAYVTRLVQRRLTLTPTLTPSEAVLGT